MTINSVDLFTMEEHTIIADWLHVEPRCDATALPHITNALETLGFVGNASGYSEDDAAVGFSKSA